MQDDEGATRGPETTAALEPAGFGEEIDASSLAGSVDGIGMLVITRGPGAGSRFALEGGETLVGRHPEADVLLDDVTVSRRHAVLAIAGDRVVLTDQASLNGTYVAGERVESHVLTEGDEIQIGRFRLVFLSGGPGRASETDGI